MSIARESLGGASDLGAPAGRGLSDEVVAQWKRRLNTIAGRPVGDPTLHLVGDEAISLYGIDLDVESVNPEAFEVYMYTEPLTLIGSSFAALRSPVKLSRRDANARSRPSDDLVVGTMIDYATTRIERGGRPIRYRPGELILTGNSTSYVQLAETPVDSVGVVIPRRLLGKRRAAIERSWQPFVSGSLLARATAAFITSFAVPTAAGLDPKPSAETELAVVDLIVSALGELSGVSSTLTDNPVFVREATLDLIERYHTDPEFGVEVIAAELHLSRRQVYRYFEDSEQSLAGRIAERRVRTALDLMNAQPQTAVGIIALRSGFVSVATFRSRFRAQVGIGPSEARALLISGEQLPTVTAAEPTVTAVTAEPAEPAGAGEAIPAAATAD